MGKYLSVIQYHITRYTFTVKIHFEKPGFLSENIFITGGEKPGFFMSVYLDDQVF
ncbi:Uncharacterized protein dnm_073780 [Desulfonema magnum]|uniref:Uncharacterized protein n=1 Tax=Desulfonema magnum TaxID=45655 RepID=A0A975BU63_9BACT|nr:Uncharacterized protein dnm_073780 [Desulfonema magnum]